MTDWNKIVYWKNRMNEKINRSFEETIVLFKDIQQTIDVMRVRKPVEMKRIMADIATSYDDLKKMVDTLDDEPLQKE